MNFLKNQITTSMAMLPVSIAIAVVLWLWQAPRTLESVAGLACVLILTLVLRWTSNTLQFIRVRSWAVSSLFVLLMAACAPLHGWSLEVMGITALYMVHVGGLLYSTYVARPHVSVFISSVALGCLTMVLPKTVWLLPFSVMAMMVPLRIWSARVLAALFLGLLLPYELWAAWHLVHGTLVEAATAFASAVVPEQLASFKPQSSLLTTQSLLLTPVLLFSIISLVHFMRTSLDDKIATRMRYIVLLLQWPVLLVLVAILGQESRAESQGIMSLAPAWLLCCSPLLARYFVFSRGWQAGLAFWLFVLILIAMSLYPLFCNLLTL